VREVEALRGPPLPKRRQAPAAAHVDPRAAELLRTQTLAGNRAVSGLLVQRYKPLGVDGYIPAPDTKPGARAPFTLAGDQIKPTARPGGKKGLGMGYEVSKPDRPPLLVADDETLAINAEKGEPKEFYADPEVLKRGNTTLEALGSPVELVAAGNEVTLPAGEAAPKRLVMVQPGIRAQAAPGADAFVSLAIDICRDVAKQILGNITHARIGKGAESTTVPIETTGSQVVGGTHPLAEALSKGPVSVGDAKTKLGAHDVPESGKEYGGASAAGDVAERGKDLGINEQARARVGEGYVTQTIAGAEGPKKDWSKGGADPVEHEFVWGYHYSSVIAQSLDEADQIAMENYARKGDLEQGQKRLLAQLQSDFAAEISGLRLEGADREQIGAILHKLETGNVASVKDATDAYTQMLTEKLGGLRSMWYFRMLGSKKGQSFHEQMAASDYFSNPLTMVVGNYERTQPVNLWFDAFASELTQVHRNNLDVLVKQARADRHQGRPLRLTITGWANDKWLGPLDSRSAAARAEMVRAYLVGRGLDNGILTVVNGGATKKFGAADSANRRVVITPG
jgi:outer membrane protein OmpA-like peptidoglycan-associated protein